MRQSAKISRGLPLLIILCYSAIGIAQEPREWRDTKERVQLHNDAIEADFQAGILYRLKDLATGEILVTADPADLTSKLPLFGKSQIDLDTCGIAQNQSDNSLDTRITSRDGVTWELHWMIEPGKGDLVLRNSAIATHPVEEMRVLFFGCDIANHALVWVDANGVGKSCRAPWTGDFLGNPVSTGAPWSFVHPLVSLFEGRNAGWFIEGRDTNIGPSSCMVHGNGQTANLGMIRSFPVPTNRPEMFEIRLRTYQRHWEDAVDPYVQWMEAQGYVPFERKSPSWTREIVNQAYIPVGDFDDLESLAKEVNPSKTLIGRNADYRSYGFDVGYPDYEPTELAKKWLKRARAMGFHVGAHFNSMGISRMFPDLVERMRPGFQVTGYDSSGNPTYDSIYDGEMINCSAAYKPFRDLLIQRMRDAVAAGVDVVYLDETNGLGGKFLVDGMTGIQGIVELEKEILQTYPNVAVETEQFNPMSSRYAAFALSQMPMGHPLSAYIYHRFVKVVPEGVMSAPIDEALIDEVQSWGCMTLGAGPMDHPWIEIAKAFEDYGLKPDFRLDRQEFRDYQSDPSEGAMPVAEPIPHGATLRLFGYRGHDGVTAFFEKQKYQRGLVIYQPGRNPRWVGACHVGITKWPGPGAPVFEQIGRRRPYWFLYNGSTILGLDPAQTYVFTDQVELPPDRFHVTAVPPDFQQYYDGGRRIISQDIGDQGSYYKITFTGHGQIDAFAPAGYDLYFNDQKMTAKPGTLVQSAKVSADSSCPAVLRAFRRTDTLLVGKWVQLPWHGAWYIPGYIVANSDLGFTGSTTGIGTLIGKFPTARRLRLRGSYGIPPGSNGLFGDGVVRINGKEIVRVPHGDPPFKMRDFDVDISSYSGAYVMLEFSSEGEIGGVSPLMQWDDPQIVAVP